MIIVATFARKTSLPTLTPTPEWVFNEPGRVVAPILLYHHIEDIDYKTRFIVDTDDFRTQMQLLDEWGYTVIPMSLFMEALLHGAELPARPIVLTFDDGQRNIYDNAFPIMQEYGTPGVFYLMSYGVNDPSLVGVEEISEMLEAGWEIGSHTKSHADLTAEGTNISLEIDGSKSDLEEIYG